MYICVYIYIHIFCMYACTCVRMHVCTYVCTCVRYSYQLPAAQRLGTPEPCMAPMAPGLAKRGWEVPRRFFVGKSSMTINDHKCMMYIPYVCICYVYIYMYIYNYIYMYVYIYVCMYIYMCMYVVP